MGKGNKSEYFPKAILINHRDLIFRLQKSYKCNNKLCSQGYGGLRDSIECVGR